MTKILDKKGYRISIESWIGKLGNHMVQLSGALSVARGSQSRLIIPEHPLLRRRTFDFTRPENENCNEQISGRFFFRSDCYQYPIEYDADRRKIFQDYLFDQLKKPSLRARLNRLIKSRREPAPNRNTLVINIRSGSEIFRTDPPPLSDYMQPPLSFYKHIIQSNKYDDCLIVTEPARKNPCIDALLSWDPKIRLKRHESVQDDVLTILNATDLVMCHSTFSWCLALMSRNLRRLYLPASFPIRSVDDFAIDTYSFDNYIEPGEWTCSDAQLALMVSHSIEDVSVVKTPMGGGAKRELSTFR